MENFQEFVRTFRPQHFAIGGPLNLLVNTLAMWFVVNRLGDSGEKESLPRCALCALLLYIVSGIAIALLMFPTPLMFLLSGCVWLAGSMIVIQSVFQLTYQNGGGILFLYLVVLLTIHGVVRYLVG